MAPQAAKLARQPATREFKFQTGHDQFGRVLRTDVFVPQIQDSWPLAEYTYDLDGNPSREVVNSVIGTRTWGYRGQRLVGADQLRAGPRLGHRGPHPDDVVAA